MATKKLSDLEAALQEALETAKLPKLKKLKRAVEAYTDSKYLTEDRHAVALLMAMDSAFWNAYSGSPEGKRQARKAEAEARA